MSSETFTLAQVRALSGEALRACGASPEAADAVADAVAAAERDGVASHGLAYVPTYCEHLLCGKVNPAAKVAIAVEGSVVRADADSGFAHPAINQAFEKLVPLARTHGIAAAAIRNSYNCGVLGYHTERLAQQNLVGLGFTNAPASIAPHGARKAMFGTNPWSAAAPDGKGGAAFVIDQSASVVAKSEVMKRQREGQAVPLGWVLDANGQPTTDPAEGLKGTMVPAGGPKGVGSALLVELMAVCLAGATPGFSAAPFSGKEGGPPRTGQFFIAIDPQATSGGLFADRLSAICETMTQIEGARLPGSRRFASRAVAERDGVAVNPAVVERIRAVMKQGVA
ncbi:MAG: Ldh family oxidoreductase [Pseudorhodoplanes sp.]